MLGQFSATPTIGVKDMQTAREFYEKKLGLTPFGNGDDNVQLYQCGDSFIQVYQTDLAGTNKSTALTWGIGDRLPEEVNALHEHGVEFEHYQIPATKLEGDIHVMNGRKAAWFKDPDGNILCLHDH